MKRILVLVSLVIYFSVFFACKKDVPVVDKGYNKIPDIWLFNMNDSLNPNHKIDTMYFDQALGFYIFKWNSSPINNIKFELRAIPQYGDTVYYSKTYVNSITGVFKNESFKMDFGSSKDTFFTLINQGSKYVLTSDSLYPTFFSGEKLFRVNQLKMTDTIP